MTTMPNRISAFGPLSAQQEVALAHELLAVQSEEELDGFLPLILPALKLAAPLLKGVAGSLLGGLGGGGSGGGGGRPRRPRRPRSEQEYFLGRIVKGLFGELQAENEEEEQFLGNIFKGLLGEQEMAAEEEQFLGGLIGKLFGRRELESEAGNYVQEQFLGGLIGKLFGGRELEASITSQMETEEETSGGAPSHWRLRLARRFVRLAHAASRRAARQLSGLGRRPSADEARRIVLGSIIAAARRFTPRLASAFAVQGAPALSDARPPRHPAPQGGQGVGGQGGQPDHEVSGRRPGPSRGHATWVRRGDRLIFSF